MLTGNKNEIFKTMQSKPISALELFITCLILSSISIKKQKITLQPSQFLISFSECTAPSPEYNLVVGRFYRVIETAMSFEAATAECDRDGSQLMQIFDFVDWQALSDLSKSYC